MVVGIDLDNIVVNTTETVLSYLAQRGAPKLALKDIKAGDRFTADNLTTKRPGSGISPMKWNDVIGQTAKRDFSEDELIEA